MTRAPAASSTSPSAMLIPTSPWTRCDVEWLSWRPLAVQIAFESLHSVVSGSVMVSEPVPLGRTLTFQARLLP